MTKDEDGIFVELAENLTNNGFAVFRFDFGGHGESDGDSVDLTVTGRERDLAAVIKFLQGPGYENFGITVTSFGGGAVSLFIAENRKLIKAVVFWNHAIDYRSILEPELAWPKKNLGPEAMEKLRKQGHIEIGSRKFKVGKALFAEIKQSEPLKKIKKIEIPTLFIHGDKDSYVPCEDSVKYSKLLKNAGLEIIKGGEHGFHNKKKAFGQGL